MKCLIMNKKLKIGHNKLNSLGKRIKSQQNREQLIKELLTLNERIELGL